MAKPIKARYNDELIVAIDCADVTLDVIESDGAHVDLYLKPRAARKLAKALLKSAKAVEATA